MAFDYAPLASTATKMITEFGQAVTFTRNGNVTYDPTQGVGSSSQTTYDANIVLSVSYTHLTLPTNREV